MHQVGKLEYHRQILETIQIIHQLYLNRGKGLSEAKTMLLFLVLNSSVQFLASLEVLSDGHTYIFKIPKAAYIKLGSNRIVRKPCLGLNGA